MVNGSRTRDTYFGVVSARAVSGFRIWKQFFIRNYASISPRGIVNSTLLATTDCEGSEFKLAACGVAQL